MAPCTWVNLITNERVRKLYGGVWSTIGGNGTSGFSDTGLGRFGAYLPPPLQRQL